MKLYTLLLSIFLLAGGNFSNQTSLFKEYLQKTHSQKLSTAKSEYYVIREDNCYKCYINNLAIAKACIKKKNAFVIYVYRGRMSSNANFLKNHKNVLYDSTGAFKKVNISPFSDCIIYTSKGEITRIKQLQNE